MKFEKVEGQRAAVKKADFLKLVESHPHYRPVVEAMDYGVFLVPFSPGFIYSLPTELRGRGHIVLIGADPPAPHPGFSPQDCHKSSLKKLFRQADAFGLIIAEPNIAIYAALATAAVAGKTVVIIEAPDTREADWYNYLMKYKRPTASVVVLTVRAQGHA